MATQANEYCTLEELLWDDIGEPLKLNLSFLQKITNDFSRDRIVGSGAYGVVYKGELRDDFVAVKMLYGLHAIEDEAFRREVNCLMRIRHPNIIWFVGYCAETSTEVVRRGVENLFVTSLEKILCFEYLGNGSLRSYLKDKAHELQWHICYQIVKGICLGLHYLHERKMIHLDLKPDNILLDDDMVPKIADFGVARLLGERSNIVTENVVGTIRYMAPEYLEGGEITVKSDIYSLGIIIRDMVMGHNTERTTETLSHEKILQRWMSRQEHNSLQLRQINECIRIAEMCTELDPEKRPAIKDILRRLEEMDAGDRPLVATTPVVGRRSLLSNLMEHMQRLTVTPSQRPSTRSERPIESPAAQLQLLPSPEGPEPTKPADKSFWLDSTSGAKCYMLSSRSLEITWGETSMYWKWITLPESRFAECAELLSVYFLAVIAEMATEELSAGVRYGVYLVFKLAASTSGLNGVQTSSVRLYGQRTIATNKVSVNPTTPNRVPGIAYPVTRRDGWMEVKLAEIAIDEQLLSERAVIVDFREEKDSVKKSGLIIEGIEFRTNN